MFQLKIVYDNDFLNIARLLDDGLVMVKRRFNNHIVAFHRPHLGMYYNSPCIRSGQLNPSHKVNGLGRKIVLHPVYSLTSAMTTIINFESWTYFEEGQFVNDELNGTFGRRIRLDGTNRIGWFEEYGFCLHGYGREVTLQGEAKVVQEGLFENRLFKKNKSEIEEYDAENDFIAQKILWRDYVMTSVDVEKELAG